MASWLTYYKEGQGVHRGRWNRAWPAVLHSLLALWEWGRPLSLCRLAVGQTQRPGPCPLPAGLMLPAGPSQSRGF